MAKSCIITGKSGLKAGSYSNRVRATKFNPCGNTRRKANLQKKAIFIPELGRSIKLVVSARGLRTIAKKGALKALLESKVTY
jgi:large subunit ribosomal protein L28